MIVCVSFKSLYEASLFIDGFPKPVKKPLVHFPPRITVHGLSYCLLWLG
jgi:hypothetical protein